MNPIYKPKGKAGEYGDYANDDTKRFAVYMRISPNGKKYVGCTCKPLNHRAGKGGKGYAPNVAFYADIKQYGWDSFESIIIQDNLAKDDALKLETETIIQHNTTDPRYGYNQIERPGTRERNERERTEVGQRMSRINKGKTLSPEHRAKLSASLKGKPKIYSDEGRERIIQSNRMRQHSEETRKKMSDNTKLGMERSGASEKLKAAWANNYEERVKTCRNQYSS